jgi:hypothetical protein
MQICSEILIDLRIFSANNFACLEVLKGPIQTPFFPDSFESTPLPDPQAQNPQT